MIVIAGNNGTKRKRSVKAHVRILPILHLGFNALRQFSQRLSEGGEWALRSESSLAKSKPFFRKKSTYLHVAWSKYETSKFWVLSQPTLRAFVLHLRFISRKMWKTKSLFTRSHIIWDLPYLFFLSLQVFEGSRTGKDCSKGKFGSSKKTETCMR